MSYDRFAVFKLTLSRALVFVALPLACATEVTPELDDDGKTELPADTAGTSAGGTPSTVTAGSSGLPTAGTTTSVAGTGSSNPFGGTSSSGSSSGGKSGGGASSAGTSSGGTSSGGSAAGGKGGAGGTAGSSTGGGTGGTGTGGCACPTKKDWVDGTSISFVTGDCLDVKGVVYLYTGTKAQTWAHVDCNPAKQAAWCSDVGADYKFMLCK